MPLQFVDLGIPYHSKVASLLEWWNDLIKIQLWYQLGGHSLWDCDVPPLNVAYGM